MSRLLKLLWCHIAGHNGRESIYSIDTANGVTTTTLTRETCLKCQRVIR